MSVNGASMIFVYCIYFAVENTPCTLGVPHLSTVDRTQLGLCPYYSHCNGELKVGVTSALHFFSEYIFCGWKQIGAVIYFASIDRRCASYDRLQQLKWELKMSVNGASMIFVYCIYFAVENTPWMTLAAPRISTVDRA
jgi:hypothetical protein